MHRITYKRRFSPSAGNRAAVITVPRAIAQAWNEHSIVELVFDGNSLVIKPVNESRSETGDEGDVVE